MKRILSFIFLLLCLAFVSCMQEKNETNNFYTFTDDAGTEISLAEKPKTVAVLFSSHAEMVLLSGGHVDITVGESIERGFVSEDTPLVDSGAGKSINTELLISYKPDFVIGSNDIAAHRETAELLNKAGIPTALFYVESFPDYERVMKILCDIFGGKEYYKKNVSDVRDNIDVILSSVPEGEHKDFLFIRCASSAKATKAKANHENFVCVMLDDLGAYNITNRAPVLLDGLSIEQIILEDPDYIFFSTMGDENAARSYRESQLENKEWQTLSAVKLGNYTFLDKELFQYKPNNRWDKAYKTLAELLYGKE